MTPEVRVVKVVSPIDDSTFRLLLRFAPPEKQERILRQRVKQNADNMAVGAALAKYMVYQAFHIPPEEQRIAYGPYGKPYLADYPNAHFNISHSGQFVTCAVCDHLVGIDIQDVRPYDPNVARHICTIEELTEIENSDNPALAFTKLWTRKEAYLKMTGDGITDKMDSIFSPKKVLFQSEQIECSVLTICVVITQQRGIKRDSEPPS